MVKSILLLLSALFFIGCGGTTEDGVTDITQNQEIQSDSKTPQTTVETETQTETEEEQNTVPIAYITDKPINELIREEGTSILFQAEAEDKDGDKLTFLWQEDNVTLATTETFQKDDFSVGEHTITLIVTDTKGASVKDIQTIKIIETNNLNDAPIAINQDIETDEDVPLSFELHSYDTEGDSLTLTLLQNPSNGTLHGNFPNLTYTPDTNYKGTDSFVYKVNDGKSDSQNATVSITINDINDAPTVDAGNDQKIKLSQEIWLNAQAQDNDGSIVSYNWSEEGNELSTQSTFKYSSKKAGIHTLKITVTDDKNATSSDTVLVDVDNKLPLLVIRVEFNDYSFHSDANVWSNKIFGTSEGELNHFYNETSHGRLQFGKAVENQGTENDGIITIKLDRDHPGNSHDEIYLDAIAQADKYIDFSKYDTDNNDALSYNELQVMFLVAGGENATGLYPGVWAHATGYSDTQAPTLDGVKVMNYYKDGTYCVFGESHFEHGEDASIGIIAHELGHAALRLSDLYDTDGGSQGIGNFGLMGAGNWGRKSYSERPGTTPVPMLAWTKYQAKFVEPIVIEQDQSITLLEASAQDFQPYLIKTAHENEYFLLENRENSGYDRGLFILENGDNFQGGLLITHIDENIANNNDATHKRVDVEEANNAKLDTDTDTSNRGDIYNLYFSGNKTSFTPTTSPNSNLYNDDESGLSITNISQSGQIMSADIELGR